MDRESNFSPFVANLFKAISLILFICFEGLAIVLTLAAAEQ